VCFVTRLSAWMTLQALVLTQIFTPFAAAQPPPSSTLRAMQKGTGLEELRRAVGLEDWLAPGRIDWAQWGALTNPDTQLIQSPSGIRAIVGEPVPLPVTRPLPATELSAEHRLIVARYAYEYATAQIQKLRTPRPQNYTFLFLVGRDPRSSGEAIREAQIRGWLAAAEKLGVTLQVLDVGILPTPFIQSAVRHFKADGAVIITASHNSLEWNGFKYTTAAQEPDGAPFEGGALLPARDMNPIIAAFQTWAGAAQGDSATPDFIARLNRMDPRTVLRLTPVEEAQTVVRQHVLQEARQMWGVEDDAPFADFKARAGRIKIVVDPNGGASSGHYAWFLREFGFQVVEINAAVGQPQHLIEPVNDPKKGNALANAARAIREHSADLAIIMDFDSDRANTLLADVGAAGRVERVIEPTPQEVVAMNISMALAQAEMIRQATGDRRPLAVVVHEATSRRIWEIAKVFGAQVFVVEVGEVNVLEEMRALEDGRSDRAPGTKYHVVIGVEGANGGTMFRGAGLQFLGDTCRNGANTGLFLGTLLVQPAIAAAWAQQLAITPPSALVEILQSLPGERGVASWHFETHIWVQGTFGEVPEKLVIPFKRALETRWYETFWPRLSSKGLAGQHFATFRIYHHQGVHEAGPFGPDDRARSIADLASHGQGGWTLELDYTNGPDSERALVWLRPSKTEGVLRIEVEAQGSRATAIARALRRGMKWVWYPKVLAAATAGFEEGPLGQAVPPMGSPAWRALLQQPRERLAGKVVVLTPETALPGVIQGLAALQQEPGSVFVVALARNAADAEQIQQELNAAKLWIRLPVINVQNEYAGHLDTALQYVEEQVGASVTILRSLDDLQKIGIFLDLPKILSVSWADWVRQHAAGMEEFA